MSVNRAMMVGSCRVERDFDRISRGRETATIRPQVMEVLLYMAARQGRIVGAEELLNALWPDKVVTSASVYNCINELRRTFRDLDAGQQYVETIPKRGYRIVAPVDGVAPVAHQTGTRLRDAAIAGLLLIAVTFLAATVYRSRVDDAVIADQVVAARRPMDKSIAVLPFTNLSQGDAYASFVDGLHGDLITSIAKVASLRVIARTSAAQYRDTEKTTRQVAQELGVATILEGGVQYAGDRIRINVELIDVGTDTQLWAEQYDRRLTANNIFEVQAEIASQIAAALHATLSREDRKRLADRPTESLLAYEAYLDARRYMESRNYPDLSRAIERFEEAIALDPDFVLAYGGLAESYMLVNFLGHISTQEMLRRVRPLASKAHSLNSEVGEIYNVFGAIAEYDGDFAGAETYYRKAVELSPNYARAWHWLGVLLMEHEGRVEDGIEVVRRAIGLDPRSAVLRSTLAQAFSILGRTDEALQQWQEAMEINPGFTGTYVWIGTTLLLDRRDPVGAMTWYQRLASMDTGNDALPASVYVMVGDLESAREWIEPVRRQLPNEGVALDLMVRLEWIRGNHEEAARTAQEALQLPRSAAYLPGVLHFYRNFLLQRGQADRAFDAYAAIFPELFESAENVTHANVEAAVDLVPVLREAGKRGQADRLLKAVFAYLRSAPDPGDLSSNMLLAQAYALKGDTDSALRSIRRAIDTDWIGYWYEQPDQNPNFSILHGSREYIEMMEETKAFLATKLQEIHDLERAGALAAGPQQLPGRRLDVGL